MIIRILTVLLVFIVVALVLVWILTGGISRLTNAAGQLDNPIGLLFGFSGSSSIMKLPWTIDTNHLGATVSPDVSSDSGMAPQQISDLESQANQLNQDIENAKTFGAPSPDAGKVHIASASAAESDPRTEYIGLTAAPSNTSPIDITNWSLQSAYTGIRTPIPLAASPFVAGVVNTVGPVYLNPGDTAVIVSGSSPVGVSFRENICSGYLGQLQQFTPELSHECPTPSDALAVTPENLQRYGETCFNFLKNLSSCTFPTTLPSNISPNCSAYVVNTFSYNGCVGAHRTERPFALPSWRIYLNSATELWRNSHDVIRLLDTQGRTVDVVTY